MQLRFFLEDAMEHIHGSGKGRQAEIKFGHKLFKNLIDDGVHLDWLHLLKVVEATNEGFEKTNRNGRVPISIPL